MMFQDAAAYAARMTTGGTKTSLPPVAWGPLAIVMAAQAALLTLLSGRYGFHRDELYFVAAGQRLDWGYVDQPPLTPLLARLSTEIFGTTPVGLRVVATLIGVATVLLVALAAREFGAERHGQLLAASATALSVFVLVVSHMLSTTSVDMLVWTALGLLTLRLLRTGDGRWWLAIGAVIGLGMANKWVVLMLVAALGVALVIVGPRSVFRSRWLVGGVALAIVIMAPFVAWQAVHDWPQLTVAEGISADDGGENRVMFVPQQLVFLSPVLVPVWVAGFVRLWRDQTVRWARAVPVAYLVLCVMTLIVGGKAYYAVPLLLILVAAGAEPTLRWLNSAGRRALAAGLVVVGLVVGLPIGLPILPAERLDLYVLAANKESGEQVGWPGFADTVAGVWRQIPTARQPVSVIFTANYGQAAAIERYGPERGLPRAYSGHMSYWDWGPPADRMTGPVLLVGGTTPAGQRAITGCRLIARHDNGIGLDNDEQGTPIFLCDSLNGEWSRLWPDVRRFY
jgi:4-amino-4-deoxy-L-arabinose transferase-like glycosyltransferase